MQSRAVVYTVINVLDKHLFRMYQSFDKELTSCQQNFGYDYLVYKHSQDLSGHPRKLLRISKTLAPVISSR